jgi:hypothetical protein
MKICNHPTRTTGTSHGNVFTFMTISRSILLRMRNVSNIICRENQNTHFMSNNFFFFENRAVYEIMPKNMVGPERPQIKIRSTRVVFCISQGARAHAHAFAHTHARIHIQKYVILLFHDDNGFANAPQCYGVRTLLVQSIDTRRPTKPKQQMIRNAT